MNWAFWSIIFLGLYCNAKTLNPFAPKTKKELNENSSEEEILPYPDLPVNLPDQYEFIETTTPVPIRRPHDPTQDVDPDRKEIEYRVRFTEWDSLIDLVCSPRDYDYWAQQPNMYQRRYLTWFGDQQQFEIFQLDHFPLKWVNANADQLPQKNPVTGGIDENEAPFFVCSVEERHRVIGLISPNIGKCLTPIRDEVDGINGTSDNAFLEHDSYLLLTNPRNLTLVWSPVSDWTKVPSTSVVSYRKPYIGTRYIGQVHLTSLGNVPFFANMPQKVSNKVMDSQDSVLTVSEYWSPEYLVKLVFGPNSGTVKLSCDATSRKFDSDLYQEKASAKISRKIVGEREGENEERVEWEIFEKIPEPSLVWIDANRNWLKPKYLVYGGRDSKGNSAYVCRCVHCHDGKTIPGYVSLQTGLCNVIYEGGTEWSREAQQYLKIYYEHAHATYQVLSNPDKLNLAWIGNFTGGELPEAGVVIGGRVSGQKFYIGRLRLDGDPKSRIIGMVNATVGSRTGYRRLLKDRYDRHEDYRTKVLPFYEVLTVKQN